MYIDDPVRNGAVVRLHEDADNPNHVNIDDPRGAAFWSFDKVFSLRRRGMSEFLYI
jgi:hypothetical protein